MGDAVGLLNSVTTSAGSNASAAVSQQRQNLLGLVAGSLSSSGGAPADAATVAATAELLSGLTANPSQLTASSQASAVGALASLLSASAGSGPPQAVSAATANAVASAASSVALAAVLTGGSGSGRPSAGGGGASNANSAPASEDAAAASAAVAVMASVVNVIDQLAEGQASALSAAPAADGSSTAAAPPAVVISTPAFQLSIQQYGGGSRRRLLDATAAPITAPGSSAAFDPLPAAALAGAGQGAVRVKFLNLGFDPHSTLGASAAAGRGGMTRLALTFQSNGSAPFEPLEVSGLAQPITFTLPPPKNLLSSDAGAGAGSSSSSDSAAFGGPLVDTGLQAVCSFFDASLGAYSSQGCVAQPSPLPPGVAVDWVAGFSAASPLALARGPSWPAAKV